jgi:hypothetical protein
MNEMPFTLKRLAAELATIGALAVVAPAGNTIEGTFGPCSRPSAEGQGGTGTADHQVCQGSGLSFIGPATGQVATVIGPTITGPATNLNVVVSGGAAGVG